MPTTKEVAAAPRFFRALRGGRAPTARRVEAELLDCLPAEDPRAIRSRRDLRLCNALMFQPAIMARLLGRRVGEGPRTMVDIGSGDGTAMLAVARRLAHRWPDVSLTLVDRVNIVSDATVAAFAKLGWRVNRLAADVFDFFDQPRQFDVSTASLVLHHFPNDNLAHLFAQIARSTRVFVAGEPRRGHVPAIGARFLWALGCGEVTLHDAPASVRAGFRGKELSALWPADDGWRLSEHEATPFSHCFTAVRAEPGVAG